MTDQSAWPYLELPGGVMSCSICDEQWPVGEDGKHDVTCGYAKLLAEVVALRHQDGRREQAKRNAAPAALPNSVSDPAPGAHRGERGMRYDRQGYYPPAEVWVLWDSIGEYLDVTEDADEAAKSPYVVGHYRLARNNSRVADDAIGLFLEYRDQHGKDESQARAAAVCEFLDAAANDESEAAR